MVEKKQGLQYEPENLDVKSVLLSNWISLADMKNQELEPWSTLNYRVIQ